MEKKRIEILSPAGSYESLKAAICAGADAVYLGGTRFGARAFAENFREEILLEAIDYVHLHGRKIYLTVNTLLKESELNETFYDYLLPYYKRGLDAVIVQDVGVLKFVKEHFPDLPIHASTQMTVTNVLGAKFLEEMGVTRVVTSREMNLGEIHEIAEQTDLEIESFVHGALCYCYSGQCLYSSFIGGRSGNRGQCAQPCRLPYRAEGQKEESYLLSLKDICTLELIPKLLECGICSFKIEGRMKKPEYVWLVTHLYRKYVDLYLSLGKEGFFVDPKDKEKLMDLYNRGGFHTGYYETQNGREMISLKRPNHGGVPALSIECVKGRKIFARALTEIHPKDVIELSKEKENYTFSNGAAKGELLSFETRNKLSFKVGQVLNRTRNEELIREIQRSILEDKPKAKIRGILTLALDAPACLMLSCRGTVVEVFGEVPQRSMNQPAQAERVRKQMCKTGATEFEFEQLEVQISGELFLPMQALNDLRRNGIQTLSQKLLASYAREEYERSTPAAGEGDGSLNKQAGSMALYVYAEQVSHFEEALSFDCVERIYLDANAIRQIYSSKEGKELIFLGHQKGKKVYLALPHIFRENTKNLYREWYEYLISQGWDGFLIQNLESYQFLKEMGYDGEIVTDYNLYQLNRQAKAFWREFGIHSFTAPLELNDRELKELGISEGELVVYGYLPMMVSAQCITKTTKGCKQKEGICSFTDRYRKEFQAKNHCDYCYNIIYNCVPLNLMGCKKEITELCPKAIRLHFTMEDESTVREVLFGFEDVFLSNQEDSEPNRDFTKGHFKRGIK